MPAASRTPGFFHDGGPTTASFLVTVDGEDIGRFQEVTGLEVSVETETYQEGGQHGFAHVLSGRMTWPNLVLKRGVTEDDALLRWLHGSTGASTAGGAARSTTTMAITLVDSQGRYLRTWNVDRAIPVRWAGPSLALENDDFPMEELEVAHHGFQVD